MRKLLKKIRCVLVDKLRVYKQTQRFKLMSKRTQELRIIKKSDKQRWEDSEELLENWNERTFLIAEMIPDNAKIIEFGAGNMILKTYLSSNCKYQGSDIVQRFPEVRLCDLNEGIDFSLNEFDTAVFSGVLEYVYDIEQVFKQLKNEINTVILSYACSDIVSVNRLTMGWLSDYSKNELENVFFRNGYEITEYLEWNKQSIYKLNHN